MSAAGLKPYLIINLACIFWAGNMTLGRALRDAIGPGTIVFGRGLLSLAILLVLLRVLEKQAWPRLGGDFRLLLFMAISGVVGYQGALYWGLHTTDAINASLMNSAAPLVTLIMAWLLIRSPIRGPQLGGILLSIFGIGVILSRGNPAHLLALEFRQGDLLILGAILLWGGYSIAGQKVMRGRSVLSVTAAITAISLPVAAPFGIREMMQGLPEISLLTVGGILYMAVFVGAGALLCWNYAVKSLGPAQAMALMNLTPVYTVLMSWVLLGETMSRYQFAGAALVVSGCLLAAYAGSRSPAGPAPGRAAGQAAAQANERANEKATEKVTRPATTASREGGRGE